MAPAKILILDDDEAITELLQMALEAEGFLVLALNDPRGSLDACRALKPDLILLDWRMPLLSGEEVLRLLARDGDLAAIPVVAFTAGPEEIPTTRACIRKPFDFAHFLGVLRSVLAPVPA